MTELYIMRHGETPWNALDKVLGRTDIPLNERGRAQARKAAEELKDIPFDLILTSPLSRAQDTGRAVLERQAPGCQLRVEPRLIEQDFGIFEGAHRDDPDYQAEKRRFLSRHQGGESYLDMAGRIYPLLEELARDCPDKKVLLVAHGGVCRIITSYFQDLSNEDFVTFVIPNCEVRRFILG